MTNETLYEAHLALQAAQAKVSGLKQDAMKNEKAIREAEDALKDASTKVADATTDLKERESQVLKAKADLESAKLAKDKIQLSNYEDTDEFTAQQQFDQAITENQKKQDKHTREIADYETALTEATDRLKKATADQTVAEATVERLQNSDIAKLIEAAQAEQEAAQSKYDELKASLSADLTHDGSVTGDVRPVDRFNNAEKLEGAIQKTIILRAAHEAHTEEGIRYLTALTKSKDPFAMQKLLDVTPLTGDDIVGWYSAGRKWDGTEDGYFGLQDLASEARQVKDQAQKENTSNDQELMLTESRAAFLAKIKKYDKDAGGVFGNAVIDPTNMPYRVFNGEVLGAFELVNRDFYGRVSTETRARRDAYVKALNEFRMAEATVKQIEAFQKSGVMKTYLDFGKKLSEDSPKGDHPINDELKSINDNLESELESAKTALSKAKTEYDTTKKSIEEGISDLKSHSTYKNDYGAELYNNKLQLDSNGYPMFRHINYDAWDSVTAKEFDLVWDSSVAEFSGHDMFLSPRTLESNDIFTGPGGDYNLYHGSRTNILDSHKSAAKAVADTADFVETYRSEQTITELFTETITTAYDALPTQFKEERAALINAASPILNAAIVKAYTITKSIKVEDVNAAIFKAMDDGKFECTIEGKLSLDVSKHLIDGGYRIFTGKDSTDYNTGRVEQRISGGQGISVVDDFTTISWANADANQSATKEWLEEDNPRSVAAIAKVNEALSKGAKE